MGKNDLAYVQAYRECTTDVEAAEQLGIGAGRFRLWRIRNRLPKKRLRTMTGPASEGAKPTAASSSSSSGKAGSKLRATAIGALAPEGPPATPAPSNQSAGSPPSSPKQTSKEKAPLAGTKPRPKPNRDAGPKGKTNATTATKRESGANVGAKEPTQPNQAQGLATSPRKREDEGSGESRAAAKSPRPTGVKPATVKSRSTSDVKNPPGSSREKATAKSPAQSAQRGQSKANTDTAQPANDSEQPDAINVQPSNGPWDEHALRAAYLIAETDTVAAKALGISTIDFGAWRALRGLPSKATGKRTAGEIPPDDVLRATLDQFGQPGGAARSLGVPDRIVRAYARLIGWVPPSLESPVTESRPQAEKPKGRAQPTLPENDQVEQAEETIWWLTAYGQCPTLADAANAVEVDPATFRAFLQNKGRPPMPLDGPAQFDSNRIIEAIQTTTSDQHAALLAGVPRRVIRLYAGGRNIKFAERAVDPLAASGNVSTPAAESTLCVKDERVELLAGRSGELAPKGRSNVMATTGWAWRQKYGAIDANLLDDGVVMDHVWIKPTEANDWFADEPEFQALSGTYQPVRATHIIDTLEGLREVQSPTIASGPIARQNAANSPNPAVGLLRQNNPPILNAEESVSDKPIEQNSGANTPGGVLAGSLPWRQMAAPMVGHVPASSSVPPVSERGKKLGLFLGACTICNRDGFRDGLHYLNHVSSFHARAGRSAYIGEGLRALLAVASPVLAERTAQETVIRQVGHPPVDAACPMCLKPMGDRPKSWAQHIKSDHRDELEVAATAIIKRLAPGIL